MTTLSNHGNAVWLMRAIAPALLAIAWSAPAIAQVRSESGSSTQVNPGNLTNGQAVDALIRGGDARGQNLFHRFRQFDIPAGSEAYFANPAGIENILGRVNNPMGTPSQILGTLGVDGPANLFLLDSNGILFGENARLDVQGSFFASTADDVRLENGVRAFESLDNDITADDLTVDPRAFIFNQLQPDRGDIRVETLPPDPEDPTTADRGIVVPDGESLILLGSNVEVDGGYLRAPGGRIQIGAVAETPGNRGVRLRFVPDVQEFRLRAGNNVEFADVTFENGAIADVTITETSERDGGNIVISGRNVDILSGSNFCAGVGGAENCGGEVGLQAGSENTRPGNIFIEASDTVTIQGAGTRIGNNINPGGQIDPTADIFEAIEMLDSPDTEEPIDVLFGSILIFGNDIDIKRGARITTSTSGIGNAGVVFLSGNTVSLDAALSPQNEPTGLFSSVLSGQDGQEDGRGNAGGIVVLAGSTYSQTNGALVVSGTFADGDAGQIEITAGDILIADPGTEITSSVFGPSFGFMGVGDAGGITLSATNSFTITNEAVIRSSTDSRGNAGTVAINGGTVEVSGNALIESSVTPQAVAGSEAGIITLVSDEEISVNSSRIESDVAVNRGIAGGVGLFAPLIVLDDGAQVSTSTFSGRRSSAGAVILQGDRIQLLNDSVIFNNVERGSIGSTAGLVSITAFDTLELLNGSQIQTLIRGDAPPGVSDPRPAAMGPNQAGAIEIVAGDVVISGRGAPIDGSEIGLPSSIFSAVGTGASGRGGLITILTTGDVRLSNGGGINTDTQGSGPAGGIIVLADGSIALFNEAEITTSSSGNTNRAGVIVANAGELYIISEDSQIAATSESGNGGNLILGGPQGVILFDGSQITTEAGNEQNGGNGGNIDIAISLGILSLPIFDSNITAEAFEGDGGNITLSGAYILEGIAERDANLPDSNDITASSEFGADGIINTNELDFEPLRNIVEIPALLTDTDRLIAQACPGPGGATDQIGEFYVTGRGGIPAGLNDATLSDRVLTDWITVDEAEPGLEGNDPEAVDSEASDLEEDSAPDESSR
ncbi:MAG: filamentous hemagglutinin N-terminal domain-containing protein, partial [Elainellaceae cyanobacterium]